MVKVQRRSLRYATHCLMVMHPHTKYHWPISKDKNVMAQTRKYYLKNHYLTLQSKVKVHKGHYGMQHTALWSCTHIPNIIDRSRKTKMLWPGQENTIFLKKQLFDLEVKVSRRSLWYVTHHLMVMHPHTWMILFKKQLFDLEVKGQGPTKVITVRDTPPYGHAPTYRISFLY